MNKNDKQATNAADLQQDKDNERDDASARYDAYWLAFSDWCVARGIPEDEMRVHEREFEADYYGD
jgi:hypothetical protein